MFEITDIEIKDTPSAESVVLASQATEKTVVYGTPVTAFKDVEIEGPVCCEECDTPIPPKRIELVKIPVCVHCMQEREKKGTGTVRHRMNQIVTTKNGEEIEEISTVIVRGSN